MKLKCVAAYIYKKTHLFCNKIFTSLQEIHHCNEKKNLLQTKRLKTVETAAIYNKKKAPSGIQNKKRKLAKMKGNCCLK